MSEGSGWGQTVSRGSRLCRLIKIRPPYVSGQTNVVYPVADGVGVGQSDELLDVVIGPYE